MWILHGICRLQGPHGVDRNDGVRSAITIEWMQGHTDWCMLAVLVVVTVLVVIILWAWPWKKRWLPPRLTKQQSTTAVPLRTTTNKMITMTKRSSHVNTNSCVYTHKNLAVNKIMEVRCTAYTQKTRLVSIWKWKESSHCLQREFYFPESERCFWNAFSSLFLFVGTLYRPTCVQCTQLLKS